MDNDICAPLDRSAKVWSSESIINDKRNAILMGDICKTLDIENCQRRVCDSFTENKLCIILECRLYLIICSVGVNIDTLYAKSFHCYAEKVYGAAIDRSGSYKAVPCLTDVQDRAKCGSLSA